MQPSWIVLVLPRNRQRIWRLSVLWHTTQQSYTFHKCNCTFVTTLFRLFVWLFFCLPMREWALCAEHTSRFRWTELTFGRMPILTRRFGASSFQEVFTRRSIEFLRLLLPLAFLFSTLFYLVFLKIVAQRVVRLLVSAVHDRYSHVGNCIGLLSNTALSFSFHW